MYKTNDTPQKTNRKKETTKEKRKKKNRKRHKLNWILPCKQTGYHTMHTAGTHIACLKMLPKFFPHVPRLLYAYPFIVLVPKAVWHTFKTDDRLDITEQTAVDFHWKFTENDWKITGDDSASICKILLQFTHHKVRENCKHDGILVQVFRRFPSTWRLESRAQQIRAITPVSILHKVGVPIISAEQPLGIVQVPVGSQVLPD